MKLDAALLNLADCCATRFKRYLASVMDECISRFLRLDNGGVTESPLILISCNVICTEHT